MFFERPQLKRIKWSYNLYELGKDKPSPIFSRKITGAARDKPSLDIKPLKNK